MNKEQKINREKLTNSNLDNSQPFQILIKKEQEFEEIKKLIREIEFIASKINKDCKSQILEHRYIIEFTNRCIVYDFGNKLYYIYKTKIYDLINNTKKVNVLEELIKSFSSLKDLIQFLKNGE